MFSSGSTNRLFSLPKKPPHQALFDSRWSECIAYCKINGFDLQVIEKNSKFCIELTSTNNKDTSNEKTLLLSGDDPEDLINLLHTFLLEHDISLRPQSKHTAFSVLTSYTPQQHSPTENLSAELEKVKTTLEVFFSRNLLRPKLLLQPQVSFDECSHGTCL